MKKLLILLLFSLPLCAKAQMRWNQQYQNYIDQYKDIAIEEMRRWHIPASITLAQGLFESGAGRSELARRGNNHFGIKCHGWTGRSLHQDDDEKNECFRAYRSAFESYEDHSKFLAGSQRYSRLFKLKTTDYKGWAYGLKACGYATNPQYPTKLIELIELYQLYQYDRGGKGGRTVGRGAYGFTISHPVKAFNNNYYVIARTGDTYKSIAKEVGVSYRKLARYNERDKNDELENGEVVWLKKKARKAPREYKNRLHYVSEGESMYFIAQKYGIRLKYLYKMNHLPPTYQIRVGDGLRVR